MEVALRLIEQAGAREQRGSGADGGDGARRFSMLLEPIDEDRVVDLAARSPPARDEENVVGLGLAERDVGDRFRSLPALDRAGGLCNRLQGKVLRQRPEHLERAEHVEQLEAGK